METDLGRGDALDLDRGKQTFGIYARLWLDSRGDLRPTTMELYRYLFRQRSATRLHAPNAMQHNESPATSIGTNYRQLRDTNDFLSTS